MSNVYTIKLDVKQNDFYRYVIHSNYYDSDDLNISALVIKNELMKQLDFMSGVDTKIKLRVLHSDTYNVYNNLFYSNCTNNVFIGNSCYNNIFRGGFKNNTFVSHCYNNEFKFNTFNNNFKDPVTYLSGGFDNLDFIDRNITANDIDKKIYKSNKEYVISYIDPDTLALQTFKL